MRNKDSMITARPNANKPIPPDPEEMNDERAQWADVAISAFQMMTRTDIEDAICDLTADLMHWCDRHGFDFDHELERGRNHYHEETLPEGVV